MRYETVIEERELKHGRQRHRDMGEKRLDRRRIEDGIQGRVERERGGG